ncbi:unnamed protein product [Protopolystoma xenopodis]|uniref:Uncharacterized protein n=1 Tax=Protopolystoma xenopodis TaxID=117903 RepID=A0A3S5C4K7_9PLAT|nr:unnamed protein product [Protopolystoma xenopodis]
MCINFGGSETGNCPGHKRHQAYFHLDWQFILARAAKSYDPRTESQAPEASGDSGDCWYEQIKLENSQAGKFTDACKRGK